MNIELLAAVYGILQLSLDEAELLDKRRRPLKKKNISPHSQDVIDLYKWLSEVLRDVNNSQLSRYATLFNQRATKLHDDYTLNMTLLGVHLFNNYLDDLPKHLQLKLGPKAERIARHFQSYTTQEVYKDSRIAANNLYRIHTGKAELTKAVRDANTNRWRRR